MSIYIKNLNKPVGDEVIVLMPDGAALLKGYPQPLETMEIIEVPQHGRLIDADALIVDLMDRGIEGLQTDDFCEVQQAIDNAPTVIPADKEKT